MSDGDAENPRGDPPAGDGESDDSAARRNGSGNQSGGNGSVDADELLAQSGFDADSNVLTRRQAEVLALREHGLRQSVIADRLGTSRANVSSVEASARENVRKARETVSFAEALSAPVRIRVENGTDLYDVPEEVYDACDEAGVKVGYAAPELMKIVSDAAGDAIHGREVRAELLVGVTSDGQVRVRRTHEE